MSKKVHNLVLRSRIASVSPSLPVLYLHCWQCNAPIKVGDAYFSVSQGESTGGARAANVNVCVGCAVRTVKAVGRR